MLELHRPFKQIILFVFHTSEVVKFSIYSWFEHIYGIANNMKQKIQGSLCFLQTDKNREAFRQVTIGRTIYQLTVY